MIEMPRWLDLDARVDLGGDVTDADEIDESES